MKAAATAAGGIGRDSAQTAGPARAETLRPQLGLEAMSAQGPRGIAQNGGSRKSLR